MDFHTPYQSCYDKSVLKMGPWSSKFQPLRSWWPRREFVLLFCYFWVATLTSDSPMWKIWLKSVYHPLPPSPPPPTVKWKLSEPYIGRTMGGRAKHHSLWTPMGSADQILLTWRSKLRHTLWYGGHVGHGDIRRTPDDPQTTRRSLLDKPFTNPTWLPNDPWMTSKVIPKRTQSESKVSDPKVTPQWTQDDPKAYRR